MPSFVLSSWRHMSTSALTPAASAAASCALLLRSGFTCWNTFFMNSESSSTRLISTLLVLGPVHGGVDFLLQADVATSSASRMCFIDPRAAYRCRAAHG